MYRWDVGMISWVLHRVTGAGIFLFLLLHILDTYAVAFGPKIYNTLIGIYRLPVVHFGEIILVGIVLYHALNGVRLIILDFWESLCAYHRELFWLQMALFLIVFLPFAFVMGREVFF
ncbi:MAG: succinate dehydrogenase, cytochrome b556 subunit [bacterium JZ-2024 1]